MQHINPKDKKDIEHFATYHPIARLLLEMKNWNFQVDDVLIREEKGENGTKDIDLVSEVCPVPKKYRVVHIDNMGVPWVKQLSVRGGMGDKIICLATTDQYRWSYRVDPEQLDAILLGYRYDARIEYKRMRDSNPNYGKNNETK